MKNKETAFKIAYHVITFISVLILLGMSFFAGCLVGMSYLYYDRIPVNAENPQDINELPSIANTLDYEDYKNE